MMAILFMGFALTITTSCSTPDESEDGQMQVKKSISETGKQSNLGGPKANGAPSNSYKLIFVNNTTHAIFVRDIYGRQGATLPNSNNFVYFKSYSPSFVLPYSGATVTFNSYDSTTPSSYAVPTWHMANGTTSVTNTGTYMLANYGITDPNYPVTVKFAYWVGVQLYVNGYTPTGGQDIGRSSLGYATSATFMGIGPNVYADWLPQANGDIKVDIHY